MNKNKNTFFKPYSSCSKKVNLEKNSPKKYIKTKMVLHMKYLIIYFHFFNNTMLIIHNTGNNPNRK